MISQLVAVLSIDALGAADSGVNFEELTNRYGIDKAELDASAAIIKSTSVKSKFQPNLVAIIDKVEVDGVALNELYASVRSASSSFHKNNVDQRDRVIRSTVSGTGHTNCHFNCHSNRGWR